MNIIAEFYNEYGLIPLTISTSDKQVFTLGELIRRWNERGGFIKGRLEFIKVSYPTGETEYHDMK